jgi:hypothetical protein
MAGEVVLAHHAIIAAVPFLVPMLVITMMMVVIAVQDRRRGPDPSGPVFGNAVAILVFAGGGIGDEGVYRS